MTTITIGLNSTSGSNRIRFEKLSERLQKVNIDILHHVTTVGSLQTTEAAPDAGELGCFFHDELEQCRKLETSRHFRKFYFEMSPLTQTLPELIHHQTKVVDLLCRQITTVVVQDLAAYFKLVSVLARDLKEDLQPHFHRLVKILVEVVDKVAYSSHTVGGPVTANPELTGMLFECLSHLLRAQWGVLGNDPDSLRQYYGPLLGSSTQFVRDFAARAFVLVIRKCSSKVYRTHMKKVLSALATNAQTFLVDAGADRTLLLCPPLEQTAEQRDASASKALALKDKRVSELFEGVSLMVHYTAKGVKGRLHSKAVERLRALWGLMFPVTNTAADALSKEISSLSSGSTGTDKKKSKSAQSADKAVTLAQLSSDAQATASALAKADLDWKVYAAGRVLSFAVWRLFRHVTPAHLAELWSFVVEMVGDAVRAYRALTAISDLPESVTANVHLTLSFLVEVVYFGVSHSKGRGVSHKAVQHAVGDDIISAALNLTEVLLNEKSGSPDHLVRRTRVLFCEVWNRYPQHVVIATRVDRILKQALPALTPEPAVTVFAQELLPSLPYGVVQRHLLQPMLAVIARLSSSATGAMVADSPQAPPEGWLGTLLEVLTRVHDPREDFAAFAALCATPEYDRDKHGGASFRAKGEADEDSWNASDSEGSDSGAESVADSNESEGSNEAGEEGDAEPQGVEALKYSSASKTALTALVHNTENVAQLARESLAVLLSAVVPASTTADAKGGKKEKKDRKSLTVPAASSAVAKADTATVLLAAKCVNWFLTCTPQVLVDKSTCQDGIAKVCAEVMGRLPSTAQGSSSTLGWDSPVAGELLVLCGRAIELSAVALPKTDGVRSFLRSVLFLLQTHPSSVSLSWATQTVLTNLGPLLLSQGAASAASKASAHAMVRCLDDAEQATLLEVMASSLATPSYWLRYNWLRVLAHFPPAKLATSEPDATSAKAPQNQPTEVDVAKLCLEAMCLSPDVRHEREYSRRVGVLEVHLRNGRMSAAYMRVVCGFCLGLLHFKFKPIWEPAVLVLVAASNLTEGEETMWPLLLRAIEATTQVTPAMIAAADGSASESAESDLAARRPLATHIPRLSRLDDGAEQIPNEVVASELFPYRNAYSAARLVQPDARTDFETACGTAWNILRRSPNITLKRSKIVVTIFLRFLTNQYYVGFRDDPEVPYLRQIGLFEVVERQESTPGSVFPAKILKKRLEMFLQVFAAVTSPKQLYCHPLLYAFYMEIMGKADVNTVKLAFDCIVTYKPSAIVPYKDSIKRLLEDKTIRDELVNLDATRDLTDPDAEPHIKPEHRAELIPLLVRTVYGRFTSKARGSKAARDQNIARRAAVLAFISKMDSTEMRHLLQLMLRGIIPAERQALPPAKVVASNVPVTSGGKVVPLGDWYDAIDQAVQEISAADLENIAWERQIGFLHLLQPIIRLLGFGITQYVPLVHRVVLMMLNRAQEIRAKSSEAGAVEVAEQYDDLEDAAAAEEDAQNKKRRDEVQALRVRSLCLLRIAEMIDQYHAVYNFMTNSTVFFAPLQPLIAALPTAISSCRANCPAILRIFHSLSQYPQTIGALAERPEVVCSIIRCIASSQAYFEVMKYVIDILHALLDLNGGSVVFPHSELIIASFSKRFVGPSYEETVELKLSEMEVKPSGSIKTELKLLCRIASGVFQRSDVTINPVLVSNLAILLLGMLRTYTTSKKIRVEEDWVIDILKIYQTVLFRISDVTGHIAFISRLFGPTTHSFSLFNVSSVRQQLVRVLGSLSAHPSTKDLLVPAHSAIVEITADDPRLIGGRDFERFVPVLQALSQEGRVKQDGSQSVTWSGLLGPALAASVARAAAVQKTPSGKKAKGGAAPVPVAAAEEEKVGPRHVAMYSAPVYEIIRCLYDSELVVRTAALAALRRLVDDVAVWSGCRSGDQTVPTDAAWLDLMRSIVVPAVRRGLKQSTDLVKKGFILLFAHIVRVIGGTPVAAGDEVFHADALPLLHDDPEQDFFENITHIQSHRRVRALTKLRSTLLATAPVPGDNSAAGSFLTASTFNHVMLPLAYHFLFSDEFSKKDHQPLMQESALFVGAVASHLKWNHYLTTIKTLLRQLEKGKVEREKVLLNCLCAVLDAFHFSLSGRRVAELKALPDRQVLLDQMDRAEDEKPNKKNGKGHTPVASTAVTSVAADGDDQSDAEADVGQEDEQEGEDAVDDAASDAEEEEELKPADAEVPVESSAAVVAEDEPDANEDTSYVAIAQTLVNSVLPWVQVFLLKKIKDHKGNDARVVQPHVALALTKLIQRLEEPVVTAQYKHSLFVNLVIRVVSTLKSNHDTTGRDTARDCLSRMVTTLGLASLKSVLYELQFALKEGFRRHVCNYTIRTILRTVLADYTPPVDAPSIPLHLIDQLDKVDVQPVIPAFDTAIEYIMQSVLDDLAGGAQDDREADEALRSLIREAKGSKANDTLELTARNLLFRPTYALLAMDNPASVSSIHGVTVPLLNTLQQQSYDKANNALVGRVAEALQRVALGLSRNPSLQAKELLLYLHSTLQPFVGAIAKDLARQRVAMGRIMASGFKRKQPGEGAAEAADDLDNDALDEALPSYLREESSDDEERALYSAKRTRGDDVTGFRAATWLPSDRRSLLEQRAVVEARNREARARVEVQDGASAPRLTGRNKYVKGATAKTGLNAAGGTGGDRSTLIAIKYCLTLLYTCLKQNKLDSSDPEVQAMAVPFLPLLGKCLQLPAASSVVALAVRCITTLIGWGIPVEKKFLTALGNRLMKLIFKGGGLVSTETELAQACTKGLSSLFKIYNAKLATYDAAKEAKEAKKRRSLGGKVVGTDGEDGALDALKPDMPIAAENLRSLVQLLTVSVMEITSTFQTAAFQLVREIVATRVLIPEIYDLVTKLAEQIVLSQRKGVRESASAIVVTFLVSYPLGEKRVASQLKQLINNCEFEFEEGRAAALRALVMLVKALPAPVLEDYASMLFLPSTLRVVNDKGARCREQAAAVIVALARKVSPETVLQFQGYVLKWLTQSLPEDSATAAPPAVSPQALSLVRTGAQIAGLIVKGRPDMCKRDNHLAKLVRAVHFHMQALLNHTHGAGESSEATREEGEGELGRADSCWGVLYHLVSLCEQLYLNLPAAADHAITHATSSVPVMELVQESLLFPHAWVRAASIRVLQHYLHRRDVHRTRLSTSPDGTEVLTAPNGLYHFARRLCVVLNQTSMNASMLDSVVTCTVFVIRALLRNPDLNQVSAELLAVNKTRRSRRGTKRQPSDGTTAADASDSDGESEDGDSEEEEGDDASDDEEGVLDTLGGPSEEQTRVAMEEAIDNDEDVLGEESESEPEQEEEQEEQEEKAAAGKRKVNDPLPGTGAGKAQRSTAQSKDDQSGQAAAAAIGTGGAHWAMKRLRGIGADSRGARRIHVLKVFLALVRAEGTEVVSAYLSEITEVAVRATLAVDTTRDATISLVQISKELASELLELLEQTVGSAAFIGAYSEVQRRVQSSKAEKRRRLAAEAITAPQKYAARKIERAQQKKQTKKRQTLKNAAIHGLKRKSGKGSAVY